MKFVPFFRTVAGQQVLIKEAFQQVAGKLDLLQLGERRNTLELLARLE